MATDWKTAYAAMQARGEAEFPPAALHYVLEASRNGFRERGNHALAAGEFTAYFRKCLRRDFGPLSQVVLEDWGMPWPADLGRAVLLLGRHGCLTLSPEENHEAFAADTAPLAHA